MKVLVCGGRDYADAAKVNSTLNGIDRLSGIDEVIEGCAAGADRLAEAWANEAEIGVRHFPADWSRHGRSAGPIRNRQMLAEGRPDLVVAFPGGRGTANMIQQAERAGVPVRRVE